MIGAKAVKSFLTFAIVVFAASPACAQAEPARAEKAYLQCLLAHALDAPAGDEKSVVMMVLDKCAQELQGYMDECAATGATNCLMASQHDRALCLPIHAQIAATEMRPKVSRPYP